MGALLKFQVELVTQTCINCGIEFGVPPVWDNKRQQDRRSFYCPNGHPQQYVDKTDAEKLREEQERHATTKRWLEEERKKHARTRKRAAAALCPCCNRSFVQLRRHLATKHPEYKGA